MVVVDFGDVFAGCGAYHSSGVLDEQAVEGDRGSEEQGVECGGVEALADERRGADDQDAVAGLRVGEAVHHRPTLGGAHSSLQDERFVSAQPKHGREDVHLGDSSGEYQAVPSAAEGCREVCDDLGVALLIGDEGAVYGGQGAW